MSIWGNELTGADFYAPGPVADLVALVALYEATNAESWAGPNWLSSSPIGEWNGVTTTGTNGRVIELDLRDNRLSGHIPPELGNLASLTELYLGGEPAEPGDTLGVGQPRQPDRAEPQS